MIISHILISVSYGVIYRGWKAKITKLEKDMENLQEYNINRDIELMVYKNKVEYLKGNE